MDSDHDVGGGACAGQRAGAEKVINFWHAHGGELGEKVSSIAAGFNKSQDKYEVVASYKGSYADTMTAGIAAFVQKLLPTFFRSMKWAPPP